MHADLPRVTEGVFFTTPEEIPKGRHGLSSEVVIGAQRERLMIAATELLAGMGYQAFNAGDIARRAGVSLKAFYDCFDNKEACIFGAYDRFIERLLQRMMAVDLATPVRADLVRRMLGAYVETMYSDLVVARAFQVEIDALGEPARTRRRQSLTLFARYMEHTVRTLSTGREMPNWLSETAYIGVVYAVRQLVSDAIESQEKPDLLALLKDAERWVCDLFRET